MHHVCLDCGTTHALDTPRMRCSCGGLLEVQAPWLPARAAWDARPLGVWRYAEMLPSLPGMERVSLGEGGTGLHDCRRMAAWCGVASLQVKNEGENPTGSFKDRGMTVGVTLAKAMGHRVVGCASTGNTAASLAAYAARAGMTAVVVVPAGKIALGKLAQSLVHGARVLTVKGNFDQALETIGALADEGGLYLLNSINPLRLEGQKTLAWEILDQSDDIPDRIVYPVGNAGNISAAHKGIVEWHNAGLLERLPMLTAVQAEGAAPFARMMRDGADRLVPEPHPETVATAIRIGNPVSWPKARAAVLGTGGTTTTVRDDEIMAAQRALATLEGLFVEPASAASLAGLRKLAAAGAVGVDERVVCVTTGNGLKDPDAVLENLADTFVEVAPDVASVRRALEAWS